MKELILIAPEIFLSVVAILILLGDSVWPHRNKTWLALAIGALLVTGIHQFLFFVSNGFPGADAFGLVPLDSSGGPLRYSPVLGMIMIDAMAVFMKLTVIITVIMVLWLSVDYWEFEGASMGVYSSMLLFATVGMMFLVSSIDLLMAVIALELLSITSFVLAGFMFRRRSSSEAAIKFFLVGTFSTALLLFGISYYYGYFGTTSMQSLFDYAASGQTADAALSLILVFLVAGLGFKLAMVPFHMWAPDAYEGAPTPITAFLSVAPKAAAVGLLIRLLNYHSALGLTPVLAVLAALTMTVGNLGALHQTNIKRLLAYSSIAQVGYIFVALVAGGSLGNQAAIVYTFLYLFMNMGIFAALVIVSNKGRSDEIGVFSGLFKSSMSLSLILVVFLLSLTGIPPLAGFIGKFTIFASLITQRDLIWLGVVAVINSVISLYYYFRIVHHVFFQEPQGQHQNLTFSPALLSCLAVSFGITLIAGLLPNHILSWVRTVIGS